MVLSLKWFTLGYTSKLARATHVLTIARIFLIRLFNILEQNKLIS
jgi:hypothetical protein